jgi:hypothetical protein
MILKNSIIALLITSVSAFAQGLTGVMVNSNGVVQRPTNFMVANNIATNQGVLVDFSYPIGTANLITYVQGANTGAGGTNGYVFFGTDGTTTNAQGLVRLLGAVNNMGTGGVGTDWRDEMNFVFTLDGLIRSTATGSQWRTVIGVYGVSTGTNIAAYPTNRAIGLELESGTTGSLTNRVRLIAHNGTTNTNGPWVDLGDIFQRYNIIIKHKGTNGIVELWHSLNYNQPTNNTNATISGAPTAAGGPLLNAWDAGIFQPTNNTNGNSSISIWKGYWELIKAF